MRSERLAKVAVSRRRVVGAMALTPAMAALQVRLGFGSSPASAQDAIVCTMVTDTAGLGDQNFNDLANKGGTDAATDFGIEWKVIESQDAAAYVPNLTAGAEGGDLTVGVGFLLTDAITDVAEDFPDDFFLLIDSVSEVENVQSVTFKEQEPSFLCGVAAARLTRTGKLGLVGGERIPPVIRYEVGFRAGALSINPDIEFTIAYADSFGDPAKGKELALAQFNQDADIVFPVAGLTGVGCYEAVKERNNLGAEWVIGADVSQDHLAPGFELCTARKGVDFAVYEGCKQVVEGTFAGGVFNLGINEGGVGFEDSGNKVPADIMGLIAAYQQMIVDGDLVVPATDEELEAFEAPPIPDPIEASPVASPSA
ncbi:MAG: BMP family lipoprotein [Thermomicrobiales bacterium]